MTLSSEFEFSLFNGPDSRVFVIGMVHLVWVCLVLYMSSDLELSEWSPLGHSHEEVSALDERWRSAGMMNIRDQYETPPIKKPKFDSSNPLEFIQYLQTELATWRERALVAEGKRDNIELDISPLPRIDMAAIMNDNSINQHTEPDAQTTALNPRVEGRGKCRRLKPTMSSCVWSLSKPCCQTICDGGPSSAAMFMNGELVEHGYSVEAVYLIRSFFFNASRSDQRRWLKNRITFRDSVGRDSAKQRVFHLEKASELGTVIRVQPMVGSTRVVCTKFLHWVTGVSKGFVYQYFTPSLEMQVDMDAPRYRSRVMRNRVVEWLTDYGSYYQVRIYVHVGYVCMYVCICVCVWVCVCMCVCMCVCVCVCVLSRGVSSGVMGPARNESPKPAFG